MLRIEGWGVNHKRVERKSRTRLRSSIVVITPWRALVRARALSTASSSTVARSRLRLILRIAALSREARSSP